jgi:cyd operon protein YbgT
MWYFTWILGVLLACAFGIINVMWLEVEEALAATDEEQPGSRPAVTGRITGRSWPTPSRGTV